MLPTIDRYVLRQYAQVFLVCYVSLAGLYIVIDAFGNLDHFIDNTSGGAELLSAFAQYYAYRALAFFDRTSGVLALVAGMFTVTWLQRHNEMTALLAAGVSRLRVLRPVIAAAVGISLSAVLFRETIMPGVRHHLATDSRNLSGNNELPLQPRYDNRTDIRLGGDAIVLRNQAIRRATFVLPPGLDRYGKQLTAAEACYLPAEADRPSGYWMKGVTSPQVLLGKPSLRLDDDSVVVATPVDAPWLGDDELFVVSGVPFELLSDGGSWRDYASTPELVRGLANPSVELGPDVRVALHRRVLAPVFDATLLLLGLPLVVSRGNRNPFVAIGLCLAVTTAFFLVSLAAQSLGSTGWITPPLAAWAPLLAFVPLATALSDPLRA